VFDHLEQVDQCIVVCTDVFDRLICYLKRICAY
jgi:hypothetical protein